jgi:hypothetical protein
MDGSSQTTYFLYDRIPGCWHGWTLAVLATGRRDADLYMKNVNHGGTFLKKIESGTVKADCGAVTEAAQAILHSKMERIINQ